ncbi:hypothetical protein B0H13DRAFT_2193663 [Mycena leptocephala]|nr:hypothetical protein B0H13DRAFT_2193663 [Mycena leptocephala]
MAEIALGLVGAAATVGAVGLTTGSGFTGRHELSHREEIMEIRRTTDDFLANLQDGGVPPEEEREFWKVRDEVVSRGNGYYESIESYKDASWINLLEKLEKRKEVRNKKRLTRQSNNSLRSLNESMYSGSDTSSISAASGSPPGSNLAADEIQEWADEVGGVSDAKHVLNRPTSLHNHMNAHTSERPISCLHPSLDYAQPPSQKLNGYAAPYVNGMYSQTPYGPHVPAMPNNGGGDGNNNNMNGVVLPPPAMMGPIYAMQEDISTISVVGFPEDMQEREFQNMFTFAPGFEAATLKIPNKEYTAYGDVLLSSGDQQQRALGGAGQYNSYGGSTDPYNLVTVNHGDDPTQGMVGGAGGGQQQAQSQRQASPQQGHYGAGAGALPPHKQIIGFVKFRTREEALGARDVLQGYRVDIHKGAVLKAEMAKKNLHSKRRVSPVGGGGGGGMRDGGGMNGGMERMGMLGDVYGDALSPREREEGTLVAMGLPAAPGANNNTDRTGLPNGANNNGMNANSAWMAQWRESQPQLEAQAQGRVLPEYASDASHGPWDGVRLGFGPGNQNPPINTLYVGNLPALPAAGGGAGLSMEYLEGALRVLFGGCAGFRQMSFRPKGNGPMCFVEFEDVGYATKTLNALYGNTLNGLIKGGGIRLSYSKNPLGVRTPTAANPGGEEEGVFPEGD